MKKYNAIKPAKYMEQKCINLSTWLKKYSSMGKFNICVSELELQYNKIKPCTDWIV